jgi:hypothetical protein
MSSVFVETTKTLLQVIDRWADSESSAMDADTSQAITDCCRVICGTPPQLDELELQQAGLQFAQAWQAVQRGKAGANGSVPAAFWEAVRDLRTYVRVTEAPPEEPLESVADVLARYPESYAQRLYRVAEHFGAYDHDRGLYVGPFHDHHGNAMIHLVKQEAETPGSVLPADYVRPTVSKKRKMLAEQAQERIKKLRLGMAEEQAEKERRPSKTVVDYLKIGQFPDVIAKAFRIAEDEVRRIAVENGLEIKERAAEMVVAAMNHADPKREEAIRFADELQKRHEREAFIPEAEPAASPVEPSPSSSEVDTVKEEVLSLLRDRPSIAQTDVMKHLFDLGLQASARSVAAILRHNRPAES